MKSIIIFFIIIFSSSNSFGQNTNQSEEILRNLFKNSVQKGDIVTDYVHPWRSSNDDSIYFKSDTIKVYQFKTRSHRNFGCEVVHWTFNDEDEFVLTRVHLCMEPPTRDISKPTDSLKVKFKNTDSKLLIEFVHKGKTIEEFELLEIKENDVTTDLILKRIRE